MEKLTDIIFKVGLIVLAIMAIIAVMTWHLSQKNLISMAMLAGFSFNI